MKLPDKSLAWRITAIAGALGIALGAFGAHGLEAFLVRTGRLETWETAVFYHMVHVVVLLLLAHSRTWRPASWTLMAVGVLIFSGSLYVLCLSGIGILGAITPIGGLFLIAGWLSLLRKSTEE